MSSSAISSCGGNAPLSRGTACHTGTPASHALWGPHGALERALHGRPLTWSSSHPYRSQCRTTRARCRFQISRNTVAEWGGEEGAGLGWWQGAGSGPGAQAAPPTSLPASQRLTPQSHEDGKEHGALVVEEVSELGRAAARLGTAFCGLPPPTPRPCRGRPSALLMGEDGRRGPPGGGEQSPPEPQTLANTQVSESRWYLRPWSPRGHSRMSSASQISLLRAQGRAGGGSPLTRGGGVPEGPCPPPPRPRPPIPT